MTTTLNNGALMRTAICFADKALLLAESLAREEPLIAGILVEASLAMAMHAVEVDVGVTQRLKSNAADKAGKDSCRCETMLRLLRTRGAIGDVAFASLVADIIRIRASLSVLSWS